MSVLQYPFTLMVKKKTLKVYRTDQYNLCKGPVMIDRFTLRVTAFVGATFKVTLLLRHKKKQMPRKFKY